MFETFLVIFYCAGHVASCLASLLPWWGNISYQWRVDLINCAIGVVGHSSFVNHGSWFGFLKLGYNQLVNILFLLLVPLDCTVWFGY